jgi:hypothetical protein
MFTRILFFFLLFLHISSGNAAMDNFEALNLQRCENWHIQDIEFPPEGYQRFCTSCPGLKDYWATLYAVDKSGKRIGGICNFKKDSNGEQFFLYRCEVSLGFPMSGATYRQISSDPSFLTYECIHGCSENIAKRVYDQGSESDEQNYEYEKDKAEFKRKCKRPKS